MTFLLISNDIYSHGTYTILIIMTFPLLAFVIRTFALNTIILWVFVIIAFVLPKSVLITFILIVLDKIIFADF